MTEDKTNKKNEMLELTDDAKRYIANNMMNWREIPPPNYEGICCVCGHKLTNHLNEGDVWRCHSLGQDAYQCECALRKGRTLEGENDTVNQYDLQKRIDEAIQEFKEGWG